MNKDAIESDIFQMVSWFCSVDYLRSEVILMKGKWQS